MSGSALLDERTLLAQPSLIRAFGAVRALVMQQLHWHVIYDDGIEHEGHQWYAVTYADLADEMGMTGDQVRRAIEGLEADGVVASCQPEGWSSRRKWYRVDPDAVSVQVASKPLPKRRTRQMSSGVRARSSTTQTTKTQDPELDAPRGAPVDALMAEWWEAQTPRPAQPYVAARAVVAKALKAGWSEDELRRVLARCDPPLSGGRLDYVRSRMRSGRQDAPEWDRTEASGRVDAP